jgi:hypothetical protein
MYLRIGRKFKSAKNCVSKPPTRKSQKNLSWVRKLQIRTFISMYIVEYICNIFV